MELMTTTEAGEKYIVVSDEDMHSTEIDTATELDTATEIDATSEEDESMKAEDKQSRFQNDGANCAKVSRDPCNVNHDLYDIACLEKFQELHPAPGEYKRLANALECASKLVDSGKYTAAQVGVFARDLSACGAKCWLVDTYAGFALASAPASRQQVNTDFFHQKRHFYEVIMVGRPCWFYVDLEFSRDANPDMDPSAVMRAFHATLNAFCLDMFGAVPDFASVYELDSSTEQKFSKHIIIKQLKQTMGNLIGVSSKSIPFAFRNNAQAGVVVKKFVEYARARKAELDLPARLLFAQTPKTAPHMDSTIVSATRNYIEPMRQELQKEVPIVDECVYSRNRCFRVLFSSKFGKRRPLLPMWDASLSESPARQLLDSLVCCVPAWVVPLSHSLIPAGLDHNALSSTRVPRTPGITHGMRKCHTNTTAPELLLQHLTSTWQQIRRSHEPVSNAMNFESATTGVQNVIEFDERISVVNLKGNRFCFCKGASHKSNGVYLVVDRTRGVFYQKCHDNDCRHFRSGNFEVPQHIRFVNANNQLQGSAIRSVNANNQLQGSAIRFVNASN